MNLTKNEPKEKKKEKGPISTPDSKFKRNVLKKEINRLKDRVNELEDRLDQERNSVQETYSKGTRTTPAHDLIREGRE